MNSNLAGSWAPSSLRQGQEPLNVVRIANRLFALDSGHALRAREHLLYGNAQPVLPLAVYLYRNYGFLGGNSDLVPGDVVDVFANDFGFREGGADDQDFEVLFDASDPGGPSDWFEAFHAR